MYYRKFFKTIIFPAFLLFFTAFSSLAQTTQFKVPRERSLLNGLKLLVWEEPTAPKVTLKLRIHSGAAFDPKDKMGVMALFAKILFPTEQSREFFTEDLEGTLDIVSNYDYIQITATGKSDELLSMLETIAAAVTKPQITKENLALVQAEQLKKVQELEKNPAYIADRAVARRLFGEFPYGRSSEGTSESLAKIDYADLLFAQERFWTADNATLVLIGNVKPDYAYKAARQLFGAWTKSDKKIPATFRQPETPDAAVQTINSEFSSSLEIRRAWRGSARSDKDFQAARILTRIWQNRLGDKSKIDFNPHVLPGYFNMKFSAPLAQASSAALVSEANALASAAKISIENAPEQAEFERAKTETFEEIGKNHISDLWLDVDTYKLNSVQKDIENIQNVTITDVRNVAERFKKETAVTVVVTKSQTTAAQ
jgi:predicted Zn-dependent peptidase